MNLEFDGTMLLLPDNVRKPNKTSLTLTKVDSKNELEAKFQHAKTKEVISVFFLPKASGNVGQP